MELPQKFCDDMKQLLEDEYSDYLSSMEEKRKYGLRVNTSKISVEKFLEICPFDVTPIPYINNGFYYEDKVQPAKHPYYFAGLYYLQDPSAMTPASRLPVVPGDAVLDLCAAPGGKATELAAKLKGKGLLVANDISSKRAKALLKNVELFGVENSFIVTEYPAKLREYFTGFFDKILIDAPCSGEGMFRKDPSMIRAWEQNGPAFYSRLQREILEQALPMLKDGGMLLYSTCTFSVMEDEDSVEYLLSLDLAGGDPELEKCVRIFPHKLDGEGHFLALLQKGEETKAERENGGPMLAEAKRSGLGRGDRELFEAFSENVGKEFDLSRIENKNGMLYYMPEMLPQLRGIRFLRSGLFLGEIKKKRFEPSQSLAMALRAEEYGKRAELTAGDERVYRYLKGETLTLDKADLTPEAWKGGWILVCVDGYPLGWGKLGGGVLKNKYHPGWRLM